MSDEQITFFQTPDTVTRENLNTEGLKGFLLRRQPQETAEWLDGILDDFPQIADRWSLIRVRPEQTSRYGLLLEAESEKLGGIFVKMIPPFLQGRYERELEAMLHLSRSYMCPLLDYESRWNLMVLRKIVPARHASFEDPDRIYSFFRTVLDHAIPVTAPLHWIPDYGDELDEKCRTIDMVPYRKQEIMAVLEEASELFGREFASAPRYIVHGDLHMLNVLDDGKRLWGIDPNGMCAPIEMEGVRFIRNDIRTHPEMGYTNRFETLIRFFSQLFDEKRLTEMFLIDMAFCTYNSTFENETEEETLVDLELIRIAREWLKRIG